MDYQLLKAGDEKLNLAITLTMAEVKILHNACVDLLRETPEMISYQAVMEELQEIIDYQQYKLNPHE
jgi:hypothetical protein